MPQGYGLDAILILATRTKLRRCLAFSVKYIEMKSNRSPPIMYEATDNAGAQDKNNNPCPPEYRFESSPTSKLAPRRNES